jgi:hypothetical protein
MRQTNRRFTGWTGIFGEAVGGEAPHPGPLPEGEGEARKEEVIQRTLSLTFFTLSLRERAGVRGTAPPDANLGLYT